MSEHKRDPNSERPLTRRELAGLLGGGLGVAALANCVPGAEGDPTGGELAQIEPELAGNAGVQWCDTYAELQTLAGGTSSTSKNIAVVRGNNTAAFPGPPVGGGGIFVWRPEGATSDGGTVFPAPSGSWHRLYEASLNVKWFGAKGDDIADDTQGLQKAINAASMTRARIVRIPAGTYRFTQLRIHNDPVLNPGYHVDRPGEMTLEGEGMSPENDGICGTVLYTTMASGNAVIVSPPSLDSLAANYPARDFVARGISFQGATSGFLVEMAGVPGAKLQDCELIQKNAAGSGLKISSAWFGTLTNCRIQNRTSGPKTGAAIRFSTTTWGGLFKLEQCNVNGFRYGLHHAEGGWQNLSIFSSEVAATDIAIYVEGSIDLLTLNDCYFEGTCKHFIADAWGDDMVRIENLMMTGCWFLGDHLTDAAIVLWSPVTVTMQGTYVHDQKTTFLHIFKVPPHGSGRANYRVDGAHFHRQTPVAVTLFTGVIPMLSNIEYATTDKTVALYPWTERPIEAIARFQGTSHLTAGRINVSHIKKYEVAGGSVDHAIDKAAVAQVKNVGSFPATFLLMDGWTGTAQDKTHVLPQGFGVYVKNHLDSADSVIVRPKSGSTDLAVLQPGQAQWFFYDLLHDWL